MPIMTSSRQSGLSGEQRLKEKLDASNFDINAILRGAQLTVVGGWSILTMYEALPLTFSSLESVAESSPFYLRTL